MNMRPQPRTPRAERLDGRARLREATRAAHERLHGQKALAALAGGTIGLPAYRALLARLYGFHAPLEARLAASAWADRADAALLAPRADRLRKDLLELGADAADLERLPMACASKLPDHEDYGRFVGCLYVRAGSTLGARLLSKALDPLLGAGNPLRTRVFWRAATGPICNGAPAAPPSMRRRRRAVGTPCSPAPTPTFSALEAWLDDAA